MGRDHHGDPLPEVRRIALFTDFGPEGICIGQMRAVLADAGLPVFDLMNDAPAFDPRAGAYLLAALADSLPDGTLYLCVVDPGVGTGRMPLLVRHRGSWFIGPDNGLLSRLDGTVQRIDWRPERLSESFHGRDLFAPAAVRLCRGRELAVTPLDPQRLVGFGSGRNRPKQKTHTET
ncbi:MAG: SAM-dependent chlorinase/fluorinase [gamma proteobacterium symbiont of Phacoides pectinatus]